MACCGKPDHYMLNLVLGFTSRTKDAEAELLYLGKDGNAAREALNNPPPGVLRTQLSFPQPHKNRFFQTPEEIEAAEAKKKEREKLQEKAKEADAPKDEPPAKPKEKKSSSKKSPDS